MCLNRADARRRRAKPMGRGVGRIWAASARNRKQAATQHSAPSITFDPADCGASPARGGNFIRETCSPVGFLRAAARRWRAAECGAMKSSPNRCQPTGTPPPTRQSRRPVAEGPRRRNRASNLRSTTRATRGWLLPSSPAHAPKRLCRARSPPRAGAAQPERFETSLGVGRRGLERAPPAGRRRGGFAARRRVAPAPGLAAGILDASASNPRQRPPQGQQRVAGSSL
jgi:hypothetical protein